jgi:hypothetical protein
MQHTNTEYVYCISHPDSLHFTSHLLDVRFISVWNKTRWLNLFFCFTAVIAKGGGCLSGWKIWSLTQKWKYMPRVFKNIVVKRIFGPKRMTMTGIWEKCIMQIWTLNQIVWWSNQKGWNGQGMWHTSKMQNWCQILVRKLELMKSFARPIYKWDDNIISPYFIYGLCSSTISSSDYRAERHDY